MCQSRAQITHTSKIKPRKVEKRSSSNRNRAYGDGKLLCRFTLDFSSLLKNHFECSFVSSEYSLQSFNVCFEVRSEYLRWLYSKQFDWLTYYGSQSELAKLAHRKLSERTSKQTFELCNEYSEHSELTNEHSKWFFKSELKSRVIPAGGPIAVEFVFLNCPRLEFRHKYVWLPLEIKIYGGHTLPTQFSSLSLQWSVCNVPGLFLTHSQ